MSDFASSLSAFPGPARDPVETLGATSPALDAYAGIAPVVLPTVALVLIQITGRLNAITSERFNREGQLATLVTTSELTDHAVRTS